MSNFPPEEEIKASPETLDRSYGSTSRVRFNDTKSTPSPLGDLISPPMLYIQLSSHLSSAVLAPSLTVELMIPHPLSVQ